MLMERCSHLDRANRLPSNDDVQWLADPGYLPVDDRAADSFAQRRRRRPAGDKANRPAVHLDLIVRARHPATLDQLEPDQAPLHTLGLLPLQRLTPDKVALVELHREAQPRFERADLGRDLVAVEWHARFQAQRVPRSEPDRLEPHRLADPQQPVPELLGLLDRAVDLEAVLPGVPGAGYQAGNAVDIDLGRVEIGDLPQVGRGD